MFSNKRLVPSTNNNVSGFNFFIRPTVPKNINSTSLQPVQQQQVKPEEKKMKWGEPTWFLFHTLAHKIKEDNFSQIKNDFLNMCFLICRNLPCPLCAEHATEYMQKANFNAIQTKQQLKDFFFEFHNMVNVKKGFPVFAKVDLDEKYSRAITINIVQNFIRNFRDKSRSIRNIANDFHRERALTTINQWFSKNISNFL